MWSNSGLKLWCCQINLLDIGKNFLIMRVALARHWNRLARDAVGSPSLKVFKSRLERHLSGIIDRDAPAFNRGLD